MSDQQAQPAQPEQPDPMVAAVAMQQAMNDQLPDHPSPASEIALLDAIEKAAKKSAGSADSRDADTFASAALKLAQAAVILDPKLVAPQGVPPIALHPPTALIPRDQNGPKSPVAGQAAAAPPVVNVAPPQVEVHVHGNGKVTKKVVRDGSGQITHVQEEPAT